MHRECPNAVFVVAIGVAAIVALCLPSGAVDHPVTNADLSEFRGERVRVVASSNFDIIHLGRLVRDRSRRSRRWVVITGPSSDPRTRIAFLATDVESVRFLDQACACVTINLKNPTSR